MPNKIEPKTCPGCGRLTPLEEQIKRVSRSSGRQTISWRCKSCEKKVIGSKPS